MRRFERYRGRVVGVRPCGAGSRLELRAEPGSGFGAPSSEGVLRIDFARCEILSFSGCMWIDPPRPPQVFVKVDLSPEEVRIGARVVQEREYE